MRWITLTLTLLVTSPAARGGEAPQHTPRGNEGIAARYPGDVGIERDPAVIFVEDFEDKPQVVSWMKAGGWFGGAKFGPGLGLELTDKVPAAAGRRCLQFNHKQGQKSAGGMFHRLKENETVYVRYYRRFEKDWVWPQGYGPHDVGLYAYREPFRGPTSADLFVLLDFWKTGDTVVNVGDVNPEVKQWKRNYGRGPLGYKRVPWNRSQPDKIAPLKWHCVEYMVRLSTPGKQDGAVKLWVNGKLVSEFTAVPLRDAGQADLRLKLLLLSAYFHPGMPKDQLHWADQMVVATKYIGPITPRTGGLGQTTATPARGAAHTERGAAATARGPGRTPRGGRGIAARYPGDVGIENDPAVVMFLDFETKSWRQGWRGTKMQLYSLTSAPEHVFRGRSALEQTLKPGGTGLTMLYNFPKGRRFERLHTRFYVKFPQDFQINSNMKFSGFGGVPPDKPTWWAIGRAGIKPTGFDKFYGIVHLHPNLKPGFYYYHVDQRGGYGDHKVFGPRLERGKWHCVEVMLKLNDPDQRNGEIRCWIDGKAAGEVTGLRWRLTPKMQIATLTDQGYINKGVPSEQRFWIDNRVVATEYIGPIAQRRLRAKKKTRSDRIILTAMVPQPAGPLAAYAAAIRAAEKMAQAGEANAAAAAYENIAHSLGADQQAARERISLRLDGLKARSEVLELIVRGLETQGAKAVYVDFAGRLERARLVRASASEGVFAVKGSQIPLAWRSVSPARLGGIAAKFTGSAADRLAIAKYLLACGEKQGARGLLDQVLAARPSRTEAAQARRILAAAR